MKIVKKDKVVFWGAGAYANIVWNQISKFEYFCDQYLAFTDNNNTLWGKTVHSIKIVSPKELEKMDVDIFVITSNNYEKEIKKQLKHIMEIPEEKIYSFIEYMRKSYAKWMHIKRYANYMQTERQNSCFDIKKMVVYTAITGEYDDLKEPLYRGDELIYVCFTNNRKLKSNVWNIEYVKDNYLDDMQLAKKIKLYPNLYFSEFETSIWVDGKFEIRSDFRDYVKEYGGNAPILCFPHYERNCIYDEAVACVWLHKGNKEQIIKQMSDYYKIGYPINNGLYEMGCIVRQHNNELVKKIMEDWHTEIVNYSYRDQISFPVICWKNKFFPDICDLYIDKNKWIKKYEHNF